MLNWFDLLVLIFLLIAFINGYRKGLIAMLVGLATVILAAVVGGKLAVKILPKLQNLFDISPQLANVLSYVAAFLAIALALGMVGHVVQEIFQAVNLNFVNRFLGSVLSLATTVVVLSILLNLLLMLNLGEKIIKPEVMEKSFFYARVSAIVPAIVPYLNQEVWKEYVPEIYREQIEKSNHEFEFPELGKSIDSTYQKKYFETDSI